jgi:acetoin utilization deacetylase AcuC-like enzyme
MNRVAIFDDSRVDLHRVPSGFPEVSARVTAVRDFLVREGSRPVLAPTVDDGDLATALQRVHGAEYLQRLCRAAARGDGLIDGADNPLSSGTLTAARAAAGLALSAARFSLAERRGALALTRPPGHHAERDLAMGFCYYNNVALAAEEMLAGGLERVAIVDFDVHHGNATQHQFEERADVFFASLHQFPFYPGTGAADETGRGAGRGTTLNVPLPAGTGDAEFLTALRTRVLPAVRAFEPQGLLVSAGFDAWQDDPLGGLALTRSGFEAIGRELAGLAEEVEGRWVAVLEGGYDVVALPSLVAAFLEGSEAASG